MTTEIDALRAYLGDALMGEDDYQDAELEAVLDTERADQAARVKVVAPEAYPALVEALKRRVARNLAMRRAPLGISQEGGVESIRLGSKDPEIRRLEAPYRKVVLG